MNVVNKAQLDNIPRVLLFLDAEKAFDQVEWRYLHCIAENFQLGPHVQAWLQILYRDQFSKKVLEGEHSDKICLTRGVQQGCPLSLL